MKNNDISRRGFLRAIAATRCMASAPLRALAKPERDAVRPNIVLIMADDMDYECVGANGGTSWTAWRALVCGSSIATHSHFVRHLVCRL